VGPKCWWDFDVVKKDIMAIFLIESIMAKEKLSS
jgi:hypothetical protein